MDQITQQNAAMVEETTAASHSLAKEAQQLNALIGQFRIEQQVDVPHSTKNVSTPAPRSQRPAIPSATLSARPLKNLDRSKIAVSRPAKPSFATSKSLPISSGARHSASAVRKSAPDQDNWEEF